MRLSGLQTLVITYPKSMSRRRVKQFLKENEKHIRAECMQHLGRSHEKLVGTRLSVLPDNACISFHHSYENRVSTTDGGLSICYRKGDALNDPVFHGLVKKTVVSFLRQRARPYLIQKAESLSHTYGYPFNRIFIKNQKTRWGSCSALNNINLNMRLLLVPEHLVVYVILHELVHTVERNHSERFWKLLSSHMPDCLVRRKELKNYNFSFLD